MPIKYRILSEHKLVIEYFYGSISLNDIIEAKREKNNLANFDASFNHLIDLRKANLDVELDDIERVTSFQHENKEFLKKRKSAFLTDSPEHASLSLLFTMSMKNLPIEFEIFTTLEASLNWLELWDFKPEDYNNLIDNLALS